MASTIRRSIGDYEWIDEMKKDGRRRRICSSILEIIEQGDVVHVLDFELRLLGVKQGDRVGIWAQNCVEWTISQYATATR